MSDMQVAFLAFSGALVLSYVIGAVPTGLWLGKVLRGVDIRQHGSHNIGATNTMRVLGKKLGALALIGDVLKGVVATLLISKISGNIYGPLACGIAAIVGHCTSPFAGFKGGKGVATSLGVFLTLATVPTLIAAGVFAVVLAFTRMVSAGSITAAIALPAATWFLYDSRPLCLTVTAIGLYVIVRHRSNITRILKGQENAIGVKK